MRAPTASRSAGRAVLGLLLTGCIGAGRADSDRGGDAGSKLAEQADAAPFAADNPTSAPAEAPPLVDPPVDRGTALPGDRCLSDDCPAPVLPDQEPIELLAEADPGWGWLIHADWELGPNSEGYRCVRKTVSQDVYVTAFSHQRPPGTHHTVLVVEHDPVEPDGVTVCGVNAIGTRRLQGAGIGGAAEDALPEGVAMKIAAGEQMLMNLHLFNTTDEPLRGRSGIWVRTVEADAIEQEAEVVLAGPLELSIPPGRSTQTGACTLSAPVTLFSVGPHMHQLGVHMKVTAHSSLDGDSVIHDGPFEFTDQLIYPIEEVTMAAGDRVSIECTYENQTGATVGWGDSSLAEMCFASLAYYPAIGAGTLPCSQ